MEQGFFVDAGVTVMPEKDSMMYHVPNASWARLTCDLLGINWIPTDEQNFRKLMEKMAEDGYDSMVAGAIASNFQKSRLEEICTELGLCLYTPIWLLDQREILIEIVKRGIRAMIVSVSAEGFSIDDLGRTIDLPYIEELTERSRKYSFNIAGEGGEYESFVTGYNGSEINIIRSEKVWNNSSGILQIEEAEIRHPV